MRSRTVRETSTSDGAASAAHARADVDGEAADLLPDALDLAGVEPGANLEPERPDRSTALMIAERLGSPQAW